MKHILVVEDERNLATGIKYNLEAEGYRVTLAADGPSALRFFEDNQDGVDLVVLDLMLPGMSGYAVCEAIRASDNIIPILILSARSLAEDRTRGFDVGADQYLTKPFDLDEFLSRVRGLLNLYNRRVRRAAEDESAVQSYAFANVAIDFANHAVTVGGDPIRMTQLELRLLRYFVHNEGRLIPRRELLENVWGVPGNLNTRAPDQFILRLRKALEPDPAQPRHFLTLRDAGYRFLSNPDAQTPSPGKE
jgi:two-component system, OmpR family, alkaline phosphatase synthesis response regulator PhoP